jgi:hypothetical protein
MPAKRQTGDTLDAQQVKAIERLLAGDTVTAAAESVGVDRSTLYRWLQDAAFIAELNRQRRDLLDAVQERLHGVALEAAQKVEEAVRGGDLKAALFVLRGLGFLGGASRKVGYTDPEDVEAARRSEERMKALTLCL